MDHTLQTRVAEVIRKLYDVEITSVLSRPDAQFGDYATNVALQLAGKLGKNPREIAEEIAEELRSEEGVKEVTIAGPGFINIALTDAALLAGLEQGTAKTRQGKTVLVEYSDPNPLKPLHAGHLYTTLVGDSIARLLEETGANVIRLNYGGDVGRHIGISMWSILRELGGEHPEKLSEIAEADRPSWLGARYVEGTAAFEDDEQAKREIIEINKRVYQLHTDDDHDSPFAKVYWTVRQWSYDYFNVLYSQLQVKPFNRFIPESEVTQLGLDIVREQLARGIYKESQGAVVFEGEPFGLHTRVFINSEGLPTYETKDVGLIHRKWEDYHFDESIVITANEQSQYYEVMLKSVEQFNPEPVQRSVHLAHGVVKLQGGVKMSSRRGNIVSALDIIAAAHEAGQESGLNPSEDTILAAIKYALAKNRIGGDIVYDPKESIALEGNSGPYLQYAHARARSILAKATGELEAVSAIEELTDDERSFALKLSLCSEVVDRAIDELMPHHICTYLYELAQEFNRFYERNRVLGDEREAQRLALVNVYAASLKKGLDLLGITAPERM